MLEMKFYKILLILILNLFSVKAKLFQIAIPIVTVGINQTAYNTFENSLSGNFSNMFIKGKTSSAQKITNFFFTSDF